MMRTGLDKFLAISIIVLTSVGLLLSLFFLVQTWRFRRPVIDKLQSAAEQTSIILGTSEAGLNVIDDVVVNVYSSTVSLQASTNVLSETLKNSSQFFGSASSFLGEGIVNTITNTQTAIDSAQASATVIDNILTTLSKIPLIGINYNPSRPLSTALGDVSASLDPMQNTLKGFETNLKSTQTSMDLFRYQLTILNQNIVTINKNLKSAETVIDKYQSQLKSLISWINNAITSLPRWITTISWIITLIILWFILFLTAILIQAINGITDRNRFIVHPA